MSAGPGAAFGGRPLRAENARIPSALPLNLSCWRHRTLLSKNFILHSDWPASGDQPEAIEALTRGLGQGDRFQTLMGVTGSGKIFTMANVVAAVNRPTLVPTQIGRASCRERV